MSDVRIQLEAMEGIILNNLKQCCEEIEQMRMNGILKSDGFVRLAAGELKDSVFNSQHLVHAINCVNKLAVQFVLKH